MSLNAEQFQADFNQLKADVDALKRIDQLPVRVTADGTEMMAVSVPDGGGGYDEEQINANTFFANGVRTVDASFDLLLSDRNRGIYVTGNSRVLTIPDDIGWAIGDKCYVIQEGTSFSITHTAVVTEIPQTLTDTQYSIYRIEKTGRVSDTDVYNITQIGVAGGGGGAVDSVFGRTGAVSAQSGDYNASQITNAFDKTADDLDDITAGATNKHFTAADETKLDGIETGAEVNTIDSVTAGEPTGSDQVLNVVSLTQAEHTAGTPVATTLYLITDA